MIPDYIFFAVIILLLLILLFKKNKDTSLEGRLSAIQSEITRIEAAVKSEFISNRMETNDAARQSRQELALSLKSFEEKLNAFTAAVDSKLKEFNENGNVNVKETRREVKEALDLFKNDFAKSVESFNIAQKDNFFALLNKQGEQNTNTVARLDQLRDTVEKKIAEMQSGNEKKLDEMRATVDEKLQKTLETRLGESFKLVSERLEAVHKGLGDMQQLATGVGDLKRVLSNVKTRGVLGEYQLANILEQMLTPEQYEQNVKTKEGSNALVEFAVKLPGKGDKDKTVWLPVDAKFPKEDFEMLSDAYENGVPELIEEHRRNFIKGIRKCAADISSKYIDPPNTTDFAILFLPFESLYAEVLRAPGLFESIQREYKIIITGPTTLSALLNSLQMGFRTLAIEKRSSEVWQLLGAVKTEFGNFGDVLARTQKKLQEASNVIDQASTRSRVIARKLKDVQELPREEASGLLGDAIGEGEEENV
ncbi:MAG: DNA recombination protein RmuC [Filimonas sp.]|nr:DNA recombination protein RmuC [Filimonas sp.]